MLMNVEIYHINVPNNAKTLWEVLSAPVLKAIEWSMENAKVRSYHLYVLNVMSYRTITKEVC